MKSQIPVILQHIKVMQALKDHFRNQIAQSEKNYAEQLFDKNAIKTTATTALFKINKLEKKINKVFNLKSYKALIDTIIDKEKTHYYTHYPFYHAQSGDYRILQDLYGKLYQFFAISGELKNFTFLRYQSSLFDTYSSVSEFLKKELKERGIINDNIKDTRTFILSVNLSPFGNPSLAGEATWYYFENSLSWVKPDQAMIRNILQGFNCSTNYLDRIIKLSDMIKNKEGSLFQIFMRKNKVNDNVYLSWRQGVPADKTLLKELFQVTHPFVPATQINSVLNSYQDNWTTKMAQDPKIQQLFKEAIERINSGQIKISDILEQYSSNPTALKGIDHLQARILLSNDMLLNPTSGIIIYRYTTVDPKIMQEYLQELQLLTDEIIQDWIETNIVSKGGAENNTKAERLFKLIGKPR